MRFELRLAFLLSVAWALSSCAVDLKSAVVGRYHGAADITAVKPEMRELAEKGATMISGWLLEIKKNGRATLTGMGNSTTRGTWKLDGQTIVLTPENEERNLSFAIEEDGKRLVPILEESERSFLQGAKVWFKKE